MLSPKQPMYALEQMLMAHTDQGAYDEFADRWEGAEHYIRICLVSQLLELRTQIEEAFVTLRPEQRLGYFRLSGAFGTSEAFDEWLRALDQRIQRALEGDHSEPLVKP